MAPWTPTENFSWADDVEESIPLPQWNAGDSARNKETERPKEKSTKLSWGEAFLKAAGVSAEKIDSKASELDPTEPTAMEEDQSDDRTCLEELPSPGDHVEHGPVASASSFEADLSANGEANASEFTSTDRQTNEEVVTPPMGAPGDDEELSSSSSALSQICEDAWGEDIENFDTSYEQSHEKEFIASLTKRLLHAPRGKDAAERAPGENQSDCKDREHNTRLSGSELRLQANEGQHANAVQLVDETEKRNPRWKVCVVLFLFGLCYCCLCTRLGTLCHPA
ncbi:hypothetical protein CB0940_12064 [Cercospora beticola]|uniref:Uncharacterized protein n=1 Tax=Cercospora beticola TaxID=122368 RepID=A0A2G5IEK6_CERBT|nr:hypothetical protein CB0940_12064 [Cercospora beticola]PIB02903.1 hypothetical protein CB0940_12064 [Cercospora beticola]WPB04454.1 hypothetical protein RHO25_009100 [Cercospora beticola]CAK1356713.1 unnamed protein product [Cercospora beticola]